MKRILYLLIFLISLAGCRYSYRNGPESENNQKYILSSEKLSELSYSLLNQKVFAPKCVSCHGNSGGVNLENFAEVTNNLNGIKNSVFITGTMPRQNGLTDEEMSLLWNWIKLGAPEQAQNPTFPPVVSEPLQPTFASIDKNIFQTKCFTCHRPGQSGQRVPLDKDSLVNSPLELVIPENADESGLVIAIERTDYKRMPPAKEGYAALKDNEKEVIRLWITNGAVD